MFARCPALFMNMVFNCESLMPADHQPTFSPAWWPSPHVRSTEGPFACEMAPAAAMRAALLLATLYRQEFQVTGPSPLAARSWLMSACCVEPTTIAGRGAGRAGAGAAGAAGAAAGGGVGLGSGVGRGIMRWGAGSLASTPLKAATTTGFATVRACVGLVCARITVDAPTPSAMTTRVPANQDMTLMTGR